ncbi:MULTISPECIES: S-layer family protein [Nostoc]|uniref:Right-handed parallel beta-helix repeat-containing protein n=1 Tax=Nostoc paludosum FACHB-159 TaxID=2692908 RepID=A0ABR8K0Z3_9NOSO|nr:MULTISPECIES: right-handed parallel beta-helix repeat-containing protein [Nostoc]MBD2676566.1 right-handed parallel beta-helix repeat-containing protein [Nostoc sp. FACHB-857]MBD2732300.1 right-handed parallel beta-helix repeat-containing protein [Nostoc paludosum FACHB-159]
MNNLKYLGCVTLFGVLACASTAIAQTIPEPEPIFSPRFGVRYTTEGAGYESFSSFEGFLPVLQTPGNSLTFLQGKVLLDNDSNLASNILFGHRFFSQKDNRIIGGYISYSNRDTGRSNFDQLGLGFETLGSWDFRFNAYLPLNSSEKQFDQRNLPFFQGNSLMIERSRFLEVAMSGVDAEVGTRLARIGSGDLRGYAGVYYYSGGQSREAFGWKTRIEARPNDYLGLSLSLQNDDLFDTRLVFSIGANFPGSGARRSKPKKDSALARMATTVENQATILVAVENRTDSFAAMIESNNQGSTSNTNTPTNNPNTPTNNPQTPTNNNSDRSIIIHVAPGGTGNGTFEAPFGTIADALAVAKADNVIYVRSNPTTVFPPFAIPDGVRVFSSGPLQIVDVKNLGVVTLPLSGSGIHPTITGAVPTGNGLITLGNNTVISGFNIQIPGTDDARGVKGTNISNVRILDNKITNAFSEGIYLENVTGTLEIARNTITDTRSPVIDTSLESGIFVWNYQGITDLTITDNRIITNFDVDSNYRVDGIEVNLCRDVDAAFVNKTCSSNASITANILNNQIIYNGQVNGGSGADGIDLNLGNLGQGTFVISGNTLTNIVDEGISINAVANSQGNFTIANNIITNVGDSSIEVDLLKPEAATPAVNLFNNSITSFTITGNTLDTSGNDGIDFEVADKADVTVTIANNIIQNIGSGDSGDRAIQLQATDNAIVRPTINSNTINNISGDGIQLAQVVSPSVTTNNISNTGDQGIVIETASGTTNVSNNTLTDANQESIKLSEITGIATINQNNINGSNNNTGIDFTNTAGDVNLTIANNQLTENFNDVRVSLAGTTGKLQINDNTITNNGTALDIQLGENTSLSSVDIKNNQITGVDISTASNGISFQAFENAAVANITISDNTINTISNGDGINLQLNGTSTATFTISSNTISNIQDTDLGDLNFTDGINIELFDDAKANVILSNNNISQIPIGNGIYMQFAGGDNAQEIVIIDNIIAQITTEGNGIDLQFLNNFDASNINTTVNIATNNISDIQGTGINIFNETSDNIVNFIADTNTITNTSGDGIKLQQVTNPQVINNNITNAGGQGIQIETATITTNVNNNTITDAQQESISLSNVTGTVSVNQNTIDGINSNNGIVISNTTGATALTVNSNNLAENFNDIRVSLAGTASGTLEINSNTITNNGTAVDVQLSGSTNLSSVAINANQINGVNADITSNAINLEAFNNVLADNVTVSGNTINTITNGDGINLQLNENSSAILTISNNKISDIRDTITGDLNFTDGINIEFFDNSNSTVNVTSNNISDIAGRGISAGNFSNTTTLDVQITDNQISNTTAEGIGLDDLQGNLKVVNNTIQNTQAVGIKLSGGQIAKITDNAITNAGTQGIQVENSNGTINIDSNTITDANQESIALSEVTGTVTINQNIINGLNNSFGIFTQNSTGNVDLTIGENTLSENSNDISVRLSGTASGTAQINNNTISNIGSGVDVQLTDSANLSSITINNNEITGVDTSTASNGISFQAADDVVANNITVSGNTINTITNNNGINFQVRNNSQTIFTISGNTITNVRDFNPGDSILTDAINLEFFDDNVSSSATISNNVLSVIDGNGIHATNNGNDSTNSVEVTITGNQFSDIDNFNINLDNISDFQI